MTAEHANTIRRAQEPRTDPDAFGSLLARLWNAGGEAGRFMEVIEREDGFIGYSDAARYLAPYSAWDASERQLCDWAGGRVLDIGCGAGRHALELVARGLPVTGIETSPQAAGIARQRGVEVICEDVFDYVRNPSASYNCFLFGGGNLGLLGDLRRGRRLLTGLHDIAAPSARILGVSSDPRHTSNPVHLRYVEQNLQRGKMAGQDTIRVRYQDSASPWFDYLYLAAEELPGFIEGTGWEVTRLSADGPAYAVEFTAVARPGQGLRNRGPR